MARRRTRARSSRAGGLAGAIGITRGALLPRWLRPRWKLRVNLLLLAFLFAVGAGTAWGSWRNLCAACPSVAQIRTWEPEETSKLYSHDGVLIGELGIERRTAVSLTDLPPHVPQAVIAIEDKRFYRHGGLDVRGVARAAFGVVTFNRRGGGSTITQQLARIMFQEDVIDFERRLWRGGLLRKLRELQVALELERSYTKDQILEAYLNQVYLGRGYGVQAGARAFLGKDAAAMNPAESALVAAILNVPGRYDPFRRPENALQRRNLVLAQMADQGYLTGQEAERWRAKPLPTEDQLAGGGQDIAPYFQEWVRQILDSTYGQEVYRGGLKVTTTLDVTMQQAAEEAMEFGWQRIEALPTFEHPKYADFDTVRTFPGETPYLQGAFVALDPYTGAVRALIGGAQLQAVEVRPGAASTPPGRLFLQALRVHGRDPERHPAVTRHRGRSSGLPAGERYGMEAAELRRQIRGTDDDSRGLASVGQHGGDQIGLGRSRNRDGRADRTPYGHHDADRAFPLDHDRRSRGDSARGRRSLLCLRDARNAGEAVSHRARGECRGRTPVGAATGAYPGAG